MRHVASEVSAWHGPGVIILTVAGGYQSQNMWLFPFNLPLNGGDFDHGKLTRPVGKLWNRRMPRLCDCQWLGYRAHAFASNTPSKRRVALGNVRAT